MLDMKDEVAIDPAPVDVGAKFTSMEAAERAVMRLESKGIAAAQVEILAGDGRMHVARGVERRATRRALIRWHVLLGAAGLLLGVLLWLFAWYSGATLVLAMPALMLVIAAIFGALAGMLVAGLLALRPDKGWIAAAARDDARAGDVPVIVHATGRQQAHKAREILAQSHGDPYLAGYGT